GFIMVISRGPRAHELQRSSPMWSGPPSIHRTTRRSVKLAIILGPVTLWAGFAGGCGSPSDFQVNARKFAADPGKVAVTDGNSNSVGVEFADGSVRFIKDKAGPST